MWNSVIEMTIESFISVPLKKLVLICVPLKSSFASVYHRSNFLCPLYHYRRKES